MAEYSILITSSPFDGDAALRALGFIQGVIDNGDVVNNVFFYSEGVHHTNSLMLNTGDELFVLDDWKALADAHNIKLLVCITAAVKRGIVSELEAKENGIAYANLAAPFEQAGLGEFFSALHACNRLVQF
ncbi:sulfurtransferase TusD [Alteromonas sp. KUL156]|uniref:sulfurtransferase complex subunit TusD n=1 Tax=Alteromonas sp. KUL106 TaxID=2480799 RepID=UPI0012E6CBFE|nr:sulfurtransferase complex subunit TusD [Alteromonas sp. KUL106]GFD70453.1 sulfurtransferase TusD [Alteromonas sp. KUL106]GFD83896.1 sulfurtransferase TusD [Tenacibaculum sp. KUL118]GFD92015.1 sulfurtransferase TusD [Alteromonas sp. KUL154]GFE03658.1 sulfurtransferase TusD [Alteromonas sp. KUL156]